ncbi:MAG TPA: glycosyltransferase family A protein [Thermoanaerobaculia bacterium]|jgi:glycosyltransferase involved in cell wall biosynthesis|nr:glycosyltransferase family A protein [Thermoanaerobaculia bacterium]
MTAISVVIGVYNGAATLPQTLDSILGQSETDFECIAVDDGSTDATPQILASYAARDPRIRVIHQSNAGLTRALIAGCARARGMYIARHDAGDLSDPRRFALQKRALDADPELVLVSNATQFAGPELEPLYVAAPTGAARTPAFVLDLGSEAPLLDGPTHHGSVMFRRDAYERAGGYRAEFYYGQDFDLWYRLALLGKFQILPETLYTARITADSISTGARVLQERIARLSRAAIAARHRGESDAAIVSEAANIRKARSRRGGRRGPALYFIGEALRRNGDARARGYLAGSLRARPFSLRAWLRYFQALLLSPTMKRDGD